MQRLEDLPTANSDASWRDRFERLTADELERTTCDALDESRRRTADDQVVYEAWCRAERVLSEAAAKARDLRDEHRRRQATAAIAHEQLVFLIDRLGFIPGCTGGFPPRKKGPSE